MATEFLFDVDPTTGMRQFIRPDEDGFTLRTLYASTEDVLDQNHRVKNARGRLIGNGQDGSFHHVASIPMELWHRWHQEYGRKLYEDPLLVPRLIRERDYNKVQTSDIL